MCALCGIYEEPMLGYIAAYKGDRNAARALLLASVPRMALASPTLVRIFRMIDALDVGPAASYEASKAWALAGHRGWPSGSWPPGDRNERCRPQCSIPFPIPRVAPPGLGPDQLAAWKEEERRLGVFSVDWGWIDKANVAHKATIW